MLNSYLDAQTAIIEAHGGDVDKFIGDEVVALFHGADMERNAVAAGLAIQRGLADVLEAHPEWNLHVGVGIAAGEVVMGATAPATGSTSPRSAAPSTSPRVCATPPRRTGSSWRDRCATRWRIRTSCGSSRCRRSP